MNINKYFSENSGKVSPTRVKMQKQGVKKISLPQNQLHFQ
jgi:hypothetical protein